MVQCVMQDLADKADIVDVVLLIALQLIENLDTCLIYRHVESLRMKSSNVKIIEYVSLFVKTIRIRLSS